LKMGAGSLRALLCKAPQANGWIRNGAQGAVEA